MRIGILGLQGCYAPHREHFLKLGVEVRRIVYPGDLDGVDGVVLPGGESTTMLKTATPGLWDAVAEFAKDRPLWGICAGCILLAKGVSQPAQWSLGVLDIDVVRNAYGAQNESFVANLPVSLGQIPATGTALTASGNGAISLAAGLDGRPSAPCVFIRAPRISRVGVGLKVNMRHGDEPVMVEGALHMATTFHPELTESGIFHAYFLEKVRTVGEASVSARSAAAPPSPVSPGPARAD